MKRFVEAKVSFEGIHSWANAPEDVYFLRSPHRHVFTVIARKEVCHNDRDVEFIMLGRKIKDLIEAIWPQQRPGYGAFELGSTSCEMIAERLVNDLGLSECAVYEDMENGGIIRMD